MMRRLRSLAVTVTIGVVSMSPKAGTASVCSVITSVDEFSLKVDVGSGSGCGGCGVVMRFFIVVVSLLLVVIVMAIDGDVGCVGCACSSAANGGTIG